MWDELKGFMGENNVEVGLISYEYFDLLLLVRLVEVVMLWSFE